MATDMTDDEPPEELPSLADEWRAQREAQSARDSVYSVALQLHDPTRVREVADRADVSKESARDYLKWFSEIGLVEQTDESPDVFARNESYFEWRRIQRLRARPPEERRRELEDFSRKAREYREKFDASGPQEVDALEFADHTDLEDVWMELQEWRTVRRRIRELEKARREGSGEVHA